MPPAVIGSIVAMLAILFMINIVALSLPTPKEERYDKLIKQHDQMIDDCEKQLPNRDHCLLVAIPLKEHLKRSNQQ